MRKRVVKLSVVLLVTLILSSILVACNNDTTNGTDTSQGSFVVSFYDGDTLLNTQTIENISTLEIPNPPKKEGYTFDSWVNANGEKVEPQKLTQLKDNLNFYTKYTLNSYKVSFITFSEDNIEQETINYGSYVERPQDPSKTGYDFIGWFSDESLTKAYDFNSAVVSDLVLYAGWSVKNFTVTFNTNSNIKIDNIISPYNEEVELPNLTQDGYTFKGWFLDSAYINAVENLIVTKDITLFAKWEVNNYTITFDTKTCGTIDSISYAYDESILIEPLTKDGYKFIGFYEDKNLEKQFTLTKMPSRDIKLYAKWEVNNYAISFDTKTCGAIDSISYAYDESILIEPLTKDGYKFIGFYEDKNLEKQFTLTKMPSRDITLYAKWEANTYKIILHDIDKVDEISYTYGIEKELPIPIRKDKVFEGWYGNKECTGDAVTIIEVNSIGDKEFYAKWKDGAKSITIVSENMPDTVVTALPGENIIEPELVKEGYSYKGLYLDEAFTQPYTFSVMPNEHLIVYCKWAINTYSITFRSKAFSEDIKKEFQYNSEIEFPKLDKTGYKLLGWFIDEDLVTLLENKLMPSHDVILYAKWEHVIYRVRFNSNGGSKVPNMYGHYNEIMDIPETPTKKGFAFKGWYKDKNLVFPFDFSMGKRFIEEDLVLYAKWAELCEIQFMHGNTQFGDSIYIPRGDTFKLTNPISGHPLYDPNCTFHGWYYDGAYTNACEPNIIINDPVLRIFGHWINRSFIPLMDKFKNGNYESEPIYINSRNEFVALIDYINAMRITSLNTKYIILNYGVTDFATELNTCMLQASIGLYDYTFIKKLNNVYGIYIDFDKNELVKTINPIKKQKINNAFSVEVKAPRSKDFDDFKYKTYRDQVDVTTSEQLFYALQYGYLPITFPNSSSEQMLNMAKDVLREICDDEMTDKEKMLAIYNWISNEVYYDHVALNISQGKIALLNQDPTIQRKYPQYSEAWYLEGVFNSRLAVCDGISKAVVVLARIEGIPCVRVRSKDHAWNKVYIDLNDDGISEWYGYDATWAYSNLADIGQSNLYDHFLFTDDVKENIRGQKGTNFLHINAKTDVNPYRVINVDKNNDLVIENDDELNDIIKIGYNTLRSNREIDTVALNINIQYLDKNLIQDVVMHIVNIQNEIGLFKPDVNCQIFIEENKYNFKGEVVIIVLERKSRKL